MTVRCPNCGGVSAKATEAEALAECPVTMPTAEQVAAAERKVIDAARYAVAAAKSGHSGLAFLEIAVSDLDNLQPRGSDAT